MPQQQADRLTELERDVLNRTVPLADVLRSCLALASHTQAAQLREWVTAELKGYRIDRVPDYRKVAAPIMRVFDVPGQGLVTQLFEVLTLPAPVRERVNEIVPLTQSVDDLEALIAQHEPQNRQIELEVFTGGMLTAIWNQNNPYGPRAVAMYWSINPAVLRGVLGQIRTTLTEFVVELHAEMGSSDQLPSAEQTDQALLAAIPSAVFNNSTVTILTATTKNGDIMPDGSRTTIKNNKTKIQDVKGNLAVASVHLAQTYGDGVDVGKIREFANFIGQISPTLGLGPDQQADLETGADELQAAASDPAADRGSFRRALDRVLRLLRAAGPTAAQKLAISMGDDLIRELGTDLIRELPH
jgi:hypothetical protein